MKYYISTGWDNREQAKKLAGIIEAASGSITCKWWNLGECQSDADMMYIGETELQGVRDADVVIVMMPGLHGTHTEFGAALALGKKVILYAMDKNGPNRPVPFYHLPEVKRIEDGLELAGEILKLKEEEAC